MYSERSYQYWWAAEEMYKKGHWNKFQLVDVSISDVFSNVNSSCSIGFLTQVPKCSFLKASYKIALASYVNK